MAAEATREENEKIEDEEARVAGQKKQEEEAARIEAKIRVSKQAFDMGDYGKILSDPESDTIPELRFLKGFLYGYALGVLPDLKKADQLYGFPTGVCVSAEMHIAVLKADNRRASRCFPAVMRLAQNGDSLAMFLLSLAYQNGVGVVADASQSTAWLEKSAHNGNAVAQSKHAEGYLNGSCNHVKDVTLAKEWFRLAAHRGYCDAKLSSALFLWNEGRSEDANVLFRECIPTVRAYAAQGVAGMQKVLAEMLENGYGLDKDLDEAEKWYRQSAERGNAEAKIRLEKLRQTASRTHVERSTAVQAPSAIAIIRNQMPFEARIRPYYVEAGEKKYPTTGVSAAARSADVSVWVETSSEGQIVVVGARTRPAAAYSIHIACGSKSGRVFVSGANFNGNIKEVLVK